MQDPNDDLARTRHAFQLWRANRQRRARIPLALRQQAVSLLDRFPISRVARELQLDPSALKKRQALTGAHVNQTLTTPQFFTLSSLDLTQHCHCEPHPQMTSSASQLTPINWAIGGGGASPRAMDSLRSIIFVITSYTCAKPPSTNSSVPVT